MCTTQPIRSLNEIQRLKDYYLKKEEYRNYLLVSVCLNTALRICDVLNLKWENILNMDTKDIKNHLLITETKTGKVTKIKLNQSIKSAVSLYIEKVGLQNEYIFANRNGKPITRINAYYIIKKAGVAIGLEYEISCHSLRKTFGYHAWKNGTPPVVLMQIYNHSSFEITKRYLGIAQEDKDNVYMTVAL